MEITNDLRSGDKDPSLQETIKRRLTSAEYQEFLLDAGLNEAILAGIEAKQGESREELNRFLRTLGVNFDPHYVFGKFEQRR